MTSDTVGLLYNSSIPLEDVASRVIEVLNELMVDPYHEHAMEELMAGKTLYEQPNVKDIEPKQINIEYWYAGDHQGLSIGTGRIIDDLVECGGSYGSHDKAIYFALYHSPYSVFVMRRILAAMTGWGACYIDENDDDDIGFRPLEEFNGSGYIEC